jgi:hypothetical protein
MLGMGIEIHALVEMGIGKLCVDVLRLHDDVRQALSPASRA